MADTDTSTTLLNPKSVGKITGAQTLFMVIDGDDGVVRANGWVVLKFKRDQFPQVSDDIRGCGWFPRPLKTYPNGDFSMCERYPSDEDKAAAEAADA